MLVSSQVTVDVSMQKQIFRVLVAVVVRMGDESCMLTLIKEEADDTATVAMFENQLSLQTTLAKQVVTLGSFGREEQDKMGTEMIYDTVTQLSWIAADAQPDDPGFISEAARAGLLYVTLQEAGTDILGAELLEVLVVMGDSCAPLALNC